MATAAFVDEGALPDEPLENGEIEPAGRIPAAPIELDFGRSSSRSLPGDRCTGPETIGRATEPPAGPSMKETERWQWNERSLHRKD